jgi:uncharacterized protein (DUF924 family)
MEISRRNRSKQFTLAPDAVQSEIHSPELNVERPAFARQVRVRRRYERPTRALIPNSSGVADVSGETLECWRLRIDDAMVQGRSRQTLTLRGGDAMSSDSANTNSTQEAQTIVDFWRDAGVEKWYSRNAAFDEECRGFLALHERAARRELNDWMSTSTGALALLILLDQIPRNVYRGNAHAWATDPLARYFAALAVEAGFDRATDNALRIFFYMPFEHSESIDDQHRSMDLHQRLEGENADRWARLHRDIIERFGRFPHRNAALGRVSTPEEQTFLDSGGFSG